MAQVLDLARMRLRDMVLQVAAGMGGVGGAAFIGGLVHAVCAACAGGAAAHRRGVWGDPSHGQRKLSAKVGGLAGPAWLPCHDGAGHPSPAWLCPVQPPAVCRASVEGARGLAVTADLVGQLYTFRVVFPHVNAHIG